MNSESPLETAPYDAPSAPSTKAASTQFLHSGLGEVVGIAVSLGAVYFANHLLPNQTRVATQMVARTLGKWRGTPMHQQEICARKIIDVTLMNIGGLSNMGAQFALHRTSIAPEDRPPLTHELGRLFTGRVVGTITAIGTLALTQKNAPLAMKSTEQRLSRFLGNTAASSRFSELFISDIIQSVGAVAGNAPAQILFDKLVSTPIKSERS
jgi:hypothetical protein